jgi:hypothetical protein
MSSYYPVTYVFTKPRTELCLNNSLLSYPKVQKQRSEQALCKYAIRNYHLIYVVIEPDSTYFDMKEMVIDYIFFLKYLDKKSAMLIKFVVHQEEG